MADNLPITPSIVIPGDELHWTAVRASGPGGQNVNKVATKVVLRFNLATTTVLSEAAKARLVKLAGDRLDATGRIVITAQSTRSQTRNLEEARDKLTALVRQALVRPKPRRPTRPTRAATGRRLDEKKQQATKKHERSKPGRNNGGE